MLTGLERVKRGARVYRAIFQSKQFYEQEVFLIFSSCHGCAKDTFQREKKAIALLNSNKWHSKQPNFEVKRSIFVFLRLMKKDPGDHLILVLAGVNELWDRRQQQRKHRIILYPFFWIRACISLLILVQNQSQKPTVRHQVHFKPTRHELKVSRHYSKLKS